MMLRRPVASRALLRISLVVCLVGVAWMAMPRSAGAQLGGSTVPSWIGQLILSGNDLTAMSDQVSSQEELPGLGHKFELLFAMDDDHDPMNPTNDVISVTTTSAYP